MSATVPAPVPSVTSLAEFLEASARRYPQRPAVVAEDGSSLSYEALNDRASRMAGFLRRRGVASGDRVAIVLPKGLEAVAAIFAVLKLRAAYVPVDWTGPVERTLSILSDCQVSAAIVAGACPDLVVTAVTEAVRTVVIAARADQVVMSEQATTWDVAIADEPLDESPSDRHHEDLAYILYTSGSTGVPKGVMLSHLNAVSFVDWCSSVFVPSEQDRFSSHAPFHFDLSVLDLYVAVKHGATVFLIGEALGKNPRELARFIADRQLTIWYSTPSILGLLAEFGHLEHHTFDALRIVLFAGEVFPVKHLRRLRGLWPHPLYFNLYGPTETNVCTFASIPASVPDTRTDPYPIGWPCGHCAALVLDERGDDVAEGEEGLLFISGAAVFRGYWGRTAESEARFIERNDARWYNTGDVVRATPDDGYLYVGRRDRMVKRRGYRIELGEIETALYQHPQVREAAVAASSDQDAGVRIAAYLVARTGARPSIIDLKVFCGAHLPAYMSPDLFVFLDSLPRTSTDKIDYQRLLLHTQGGQAAADAVRT